METVNIQYVSDLNGKTVSVIVPFDLWEEIVSARETAYLFNSDLMKKRLLEARSRRDGIPFEVVREKLGI